MERMNAFNKEHSTLKDKWSAHWATRDRIWKPDIKTAHRLGVSYIWIFSTSLIYTGLSITLPHLGLVNDDQICGIPLIIYKILAWLIYFEILLNWGLCALKTINKVTPRRLNDALASGRCKEEYIKIREVVTQEDHHDRETISPEHGESIRSVASSIRVNLEEISGFHICPICQLYAPPRSHHCKVCNMCVLKRDHHCYFTASCIGFNNQRYFLVFLFYNVLGTALSAFTTINYLHSTLEHSSWQDFARYIPPVLVIEWIYGTLTTVHFLLILQLGLSILSFFDSLGFLIWQWCTVVRGQTSHEIGHVINRYRLNDKAAHIRGVFGSYWALNFLLPLRTLPSGSDGFFWNTEKECKGN